MKTISIFLCFAVFLISCKEEPEPIPEPTTVEDFDGNIYNIITIGNQKWLQENLRVTHFNNGDAIPTTTPATLDLSNQENPIYQWSYNGENQNIAQYGLLYSWHTVSDSRGIAPEGWHVATEEDWDELISYIGGVDSAGAKLRVTGNAYWESSFSGVSNKYFFSALPNGNRNTNGEFFDKGYHACWWTSTSNGNGAGTYRVIHKDIPQIYDFYYGDSKVGMAVRCVKNK